MEQCEQNYVILCMNLLIGIIATATVIFILGIGTFFGGKQPNTSCSGEANCSVCGGDSEKCENQ